jgi:hypothetical protein
MIVPPKITKEENQKRVERLEEVLGRLFLEVMEADTKIAANQ